MNTKLMLMAGRLLLALMGAINIAVAADPDAIVATITVKQNGQCVILSSDGSQNVVNATTSILLLDQAGNTNMVDTTTGRVSLVQNSSTSILRKRAFESTAAATRCCKIIDHGGIPIKKCKARPPGGCDESAGWHEE